VTDWEGIAIMRKILAAIPEPIVKLLFVKCPRCGHRTWNCKGQRSSATRRTT